MLKGREWAKGKGSNRKRKKRMVRRSFRRTQFLVKHSRKMNLGIGTLEGRLPLILEVLKTKLCRIWKFHPSFSPSAVSIFTRPFRRSAAASYSGWPCQQYGLVARGKRADVPPVRSVGSMGYDADRRPEPTPNDTLVRLSVRRVRRSQ